MLTGSFEYIGRVVVFMAVAAPCGHGIIDYEHAFRQSRNVTMPKLSQKRSPQMDKVKAAGAKFWSWPWKVKAPILIVLAIVIIGPFAGGGGDDPDVNTASADGEATATNTPEPTDEPEPTNTPEPTATVAPTADTAVQAYLSGVVTQTDILGPAFTEFSGILGRYDGSTAWATDYQDTLVRILGGLAALKVLEPPSDRFVQFDADLDAIIDQQVAALDALDRGIRANDVAAVEAAGADMLAASQAMAALDFPPQ